MNNWALNNHTEHTPPPQMRSICCAADDCSSCPSPLPGTISCHVTLANVCVCCIRPCWCSRGGQPSHRPVPGGEPEWGDESWLDASDHHQPAGLLWTGWFSAFCTACSSLLHLLEGSLHTYWHRSIIINSLFFTVSHLQLHPHILSCYFSGWTEKKLCGSQPLQLDSLVVRSKILFSVYSQRDQIKNASCKHVNGTILIRSNTEISFQNRGVVYVDHYSQRRSTLAAADCFWATIKVSFQTHNEQTLGQIGGK